MVDRRKLLAASLACGTNLSWFKLAQAQSSEAIPLSKLSRLQVESALDGSLKGEPKMMYSLAVMYFVMGSKYQEPARAWLQAAVREGLPSAMYHEAGLLLIYPNPETVKASVALLKTAALEHRDPDACTMYAVRSTFRDHQWAYDPQVAAECLFAAKHAREPYAHHAEYLTILKTRPHDYEDQDSALEAAANLGVLESASILSQPFKRSLSKAAYWMYVYGSKDMIEVTRKLLKQRGATDSMLAEARERARNFKPASNTTWTHDADIAPWHFRVSLSRGRSNPLERAKQDYMLRYYPGIEQEAMSFRQHQHFQKFQPLKVPRTY